MPQQLQKTTRNTFNKGLLTEFSELAFPNEASVDELNCTLKKAGNRTKRLGLGYETDYVLTSETYTNDTLFGTGSWYNVGGDSSIEFLVVQTGQYLRFFQKTSDDALSDQEVPISDSDANPYILDMAAFEIVGGLGAANSIVDVTSIDGHLVVASPQINTFYLSRDCTDGSFSTTQINFRIRDFLWVGDKDSYLEPEATGLPTEDVRKYDTYNAGWLATNVATNPLTTYVAAETAYPPLTHPWYSGKNSSGAFSVTEFKNVYSGNSYTANGHFILDLFDQDRDAVSGLTGINDEVDDCFAPSGRFGTVESFAGRVWYAGVDNRVYFSQILEDISFIGELMQLNDPTSEYSSDLLDTDGGYIKIPEANNIRKLHKFGAAILVFAENGVWRISGVDGVFRPSSFSVYKVTSVGLSVRQSFVSGANDQPFWWSYSGIHTVQVTDEGGMIEVSLTDNTIKSFWSEIDSNAKTKVIGEYDEYDRTIVWVYPNNDESISSKKNRLLLLNTDLGAFFPWEVSDKSSSTSFIVGMSYYSGAVSSEVTYNVIDSNGNNVVDSLGNNVVATLDLGYLASSKIKYLTFDGATGSLTFSEFNNDSFLDWSSEGYSAYAEAAYNFIGDLTRYKNSPYITVFLRRTETGWSDNGDGTYSINRPSGLKVSGYWDFHRNPSSSPQQAYRYKYPLVPGGADFEYPNSVLITRLKLRGRGRVVKLRFEGEAGKDFNLLGWETIDAINPGF